MLENDLRILIIDDNPDIHQDFIKILMTDMSIKKEKLHLLEKEIFGEEKQKKILPQFSIDTASQGQEGVQCIEKAKKEGRPYALAFVDIRMPPGWDGIETIKHIWAIDNDVQVVICTAYSDYSWEETVAQLGQRENLLILKKPFDHVSVRQLSMALTKKWQMLREIKEHTKLLEENVRTRTKSLEESLEKIQYQASHDTLTGLPNREYLSDFIRQQISRNTREMLPFAIFFFDLDRFKLVNDSFSHAVGDELLKKVAIRLKKHLRENDMLGRLGGDEFVFVITRFKSLSELKKIGNKILEMFKEPFKIEYHDIVILPSIGISIFPENGKSMDELLRNADLAMYHSKELGGAQIQFYTKELNQESLKQLEMESALRQAIVKEEFFLCFQPQYDLKLNTIISVEALIRWNHPEKGLILPIDFIPLAEETGLISLITEWVLLSACKQNKIWQDKGLPPIRMAVNITTNEFRRPDLIQMIKNVLKISKLKPEFLELELTENIIISNVDATNKIIQLRELGVSIAVDDFGTGYSSLNYLRKIPLDRLKIDQSFIQNIDFNRGDEVIIKAIIDMAKSLHLEVLAEGVETQKQLEFLKSKKCGEVQGFYFSKPLESMQLEDILINPAKILLDGYENLDD